MCTHLYELRQVKRIKRWKQVERHNILLKSIIIMLEHVVWGCMLIALLNQWTRCLCLCMLFRRFHFDYAFNLQIKASYTDSLFNVACALALDNHYAKWMKTTDQIWIYCNEHTQQWWNWVQRPDDALVHLHIS